MEATLIIISQICCMESSLGVSSVHHVSTEDRTSWYDMNDSLEFGRGGEREENVILGLGWRRFGSGVRVNERVESKHRLFNILSVLCYQTGWTSKVKIQFQFKRQSLAIYVASCDSEKDRSYILSQIISCLRRMK